MPQRIIRSTKTVILGAVLAAGLGAFCLGPSTARSVSFAADDEPADSLAAYYGFGRLELYKLNQRVGNMLAADLNNDTRSDLILIDNSNSRLDILQQRSKPEAQSKSTGTPKVNAIENDKRLEHKKVAVERELASLIV